MHSGTVGICWAWVGSISTHMCVQSTMCSPSPHPQSGTAIRGRSGSPTNTGRSPMRFGRTGRSQQGSESHHTVKGAGCDEVPGLCMSRFDSLGPVRNNNTSGCMYKQTDPSATVVTWVDANIMAWTSADQHRPAACAGKLKFWHQRSGLKHQK